MNFFVNKCVISKLPDANQRMLLVLTTVYSDSSEQTKCTVLNVSLVF